MQWNTIFLLIPHPFVLSLSTGFEQTTLRLQREGGFGRAWAVAGTKTIHCLKTLAAAEGGLSCF